MDRLFFVTGGAGFIGSALVRQLVKIDKWKVVNIDLLTYAGDLEKVSEVSSSDLYSFEKLDIRDEEGLKKLFQKYRPCGVFHLAAESHVDRSIGHAKPFIDTNILGTYHLLEASRNYFSNLSEVQKKNFRFLHISTDEVFGSLDELGEFDETTPYAPNSPYSASKAASDHLVRAWHHTYNLPTLISNCSNNYGPWQYPEKLIPVVITKALAKEKIPIYGQGLNIRDWLFVEDHAEALRLVMQTGVVGEVYNIGTRNEKRNIELVQDICRVLDQVKPRNDGQSYSQQISFVKDRAGHDFRYAINPDKITKSLGWKPKYSYMDALNLTVKWYVENLAWCQKVLKTSTTPR